MDLIGARPDYSVELAAGAVAEFGAELVLEQREFLDQCVEGLAHDGKVVCVRLALFAEMMKDKPWTPAALRAVGGTHGVGVTFLEETFGAATASPAAKPAASANWQADWDKVLAEAEGDIDALKAQVREQYEAAKRQALAELDAHRCAAERAATETSRVRFYTLQPENA